MSGPFIIYGRRIIARFTTSGRLSRQDDPRSRIIFRGVDGDECEDFIVAIREFAFDQGKSQDYAWLANFASTCFVGSALRWHISLDKTARSDWALLEQALIEAYPPVPRLVEQMPL